MGFYIKSDRINFVLDKTQQEQIFNIWINPDNEVKKKDPKMASLSDYFIIKKCSNIKDILKEMSFNYEENQERLEITSHAGSLKFQFNLFYAAAHIISPGSSMTFIGEDGTFIGFFFNGKEVINYNSYKELENLKTPFTLKTELEKILPNENHETKAKLKI